jgi:hypothetical protein
VELYRALGGGWQEQVEAASTPGDAGAPAKGGST